MDAEGRGAPRGPAGSSPAGAESGAAGARKGAPSRGEGEEELVLACVRGDAAAWDRFHARFWPVVARAAQRALGEGHDGARVDDVVGDVFALLLADERAVLARFEGRSSIATWLRVLTRRQVGRQLRRRAAGPLEEPGAVVANDPAPGEAATARELSRLVAEQLEGLAPRDRLALRLFYDGARSYEEVARARGTQTWAQMWDHLRVPFQPQYRSRTLLVTLIWNCNHLVTSPATTFWTIHAARNLGYSAAEYGSVVAVGYLAGFVFGAPLAAWSLNRLGRRYSPMSAMTRPSCHQVKKS